jgi:Excalibur calcium-binding domain
VLLVAFVAGAAVGSADARIPAQWRNCTAVNARYPHGVGKVGAHDKTVGVPVTNFKRSTRLYRLAIGYNKGLDRDHDGIACERL